MKLPALTTEDLLLEVTDLARDQGIQNKEEWDSLVEEVISAHLDMGELHKDEELEEMKEVLKDRWSEYRSDAQPTSTDEF